jgi:hypothetical protein
MNTLLKNLSIIALCALTWAAQPAHAQGGKPGAQANSEDDLDVTMRIIADPEALRPDAVTRFITLPAPPERPAPAADPQPALGLGDGQQVSEEARAKGREFGQEVAERAREMAEQASEKREDFGRSRAKEKRPEPPTDALPGPKF